MELVRQVGWFAILRSVALEGSRWHTNHYANNL
ncbi:hypothetical protein SAMN05216198_2325 [Halopseudomonas litoralis]|uniref:Uncharacterized protein n=1 Tax=Halopseudomonas litoralis TaxID=797277 RepID=A0A1H1TJT4_9GAMM|nr:hypothetical protein SAMN05216198_2325 [Halopseudomonas litoralis]